MDPPARSTCCANAHKTLRSTNTNIKSSPGNLAERSKALCSGFQSLSTTPNLEYRSPKGREFESHSCQAFIYTRSVQISFFYFFFLFLLFLFFIIIGSVLRPPITFVDFLRWGWRQTLQVVITKYAIQLKLKRGNCSRFPASLSISQAAN